MDDRLLARALTFAGALPFLAAIAALLLGPALATAHVWQAVLAYGAVIASFVSGIHWGLHIYRDRGLPINLLISSNLCALAAWAALLVPSRQGALVLLIAVFATLFAIDHMLYAAKAHAHWFYKLRATITVIVIAGLAVLLALA